MKGKNFQIFNMYLCLSNVLSIMNRMGSSTHIYLNTCMYIEYFCFYLKDLLIENGLNEVCYMSSSLIAISKYQCSLHHMTLPAFFFLEKLQSSKHLNLL